MRNLIIDCDPGHDDIMAILLGLKEKDLNILGFATVCGNNLVDAVTENLCKVLTFAHVNLPVCKGSDHPLVYEPDPQSAHGSTGLDGPNLPESIIDLDNRDVVEFYHDMIMQYGHISISALAPLTNIARLLMKYPECASSIDEITIMGGSRASGNIQKYSEFNIYGDPHAAKIVFESNIPIVLADIEACYSAGIKLDAFDVFKNNGYMQSMVYDMMYFYCGYCREHNMDETAVFDVLPVIYFNHPELFTKELCTIEVVCEDDGLHRGQTIVHPNENGNVKLLYCVDKEGFKNYLFNAVRKWDEDAK